MLAGLIRAPSILDPRINPKSAQTRFHQVLDAMAGLHWLPAGAATTTKMPVTLPLSSAGPNGPHTAQEAYIRDEIMRELEAQGVTEDEINRGGLKITTTLDWQSQKAAVDAVTANFASTPPDVQPAVVAITPGNGEVRAWYGGRYYGKGPGGFSDYVDNVRDPVQPGSSWKPIVLAAALKQGISLNSFYNGNSRQVITRDYTTGVPNYADENLGQINLLQATAQSVNSVFVPLGIDAGRQNVIDMAHALGIPDSEKIPAVDAMMLGTEATSPLAMTDVYATFAGQGVQSNAHLVMKVTDAAGNVRYEAKIEKKQVLSPSVAADETFALQQPFQYGTAAGLAPAGRPVAGKTGTTDNNVSTWLCGYTPQLASCVAVSRANHHQSLNGIFNNATEATGASTAGRTWQAFMNGALLNQPVQNFPAPAYGGTTPTGHAPPPPPPPPTTAAPSPKKTSKPSPSAAPTSAPPTSEAPAPQPNPQPSNPSSGGGGLLPPIIGNGGAGQNSDPAAQGSQGGGAGPP